jgi:hypothetical protein
VRVTVRPVGLRRLSAVVEIWFGGITERPSAGATGQVDRRDQFSLARPSNRRFEVRLHLSCWRPYKILMKSRCIVRRIDLLVHLAPCLRARAKRGLGLADPMRATMGRVPCGGVGAVGK